MFVGTGSDVGKSVINTAFCRIFLQDGLKPAPFKAQNMSLNSYATPDGLEIGRAQAVQAEACGIECSVEMNPILLKPNSYMDSQIVLHGKPIGNKSAMEYFVGTDRDMLFDEAMKAFNKLDAQYNPIVIEGAGSISEVNLWDKDITNMRVAEKLNAATYLIADIDKGGVFASVYGTIQLLPENQRNLIKGIIINKFRGDIQLFTEGRKILEELTGKPVVGVIPHFRDIFVEQEDSVVLDSATTTSKKGLVNVAVVLLKHMSNFTDFNLLEQHPNVHLYYTANSKELEQADIIIIPGSKNTIADLIHIRENNLAKVIINHHQNGKPVYGICGGFQIMGKELHDPYGIEGDTRFIPGLGILPTVTTISTEKKTVQCSFKFLNLPDECTGYEIHMGQTVSEKPSPLCIISGNEPDGCFLNPKTWGTYIHGIFDNGAVVENILGLVGVKNIEKVDFRQYKEENYNKLANLVRENIDLEYIYNTLQND
jgi:adenosylcobyric acid synthase